MVLADVAEERSVRSMETSELVERVPGGVPIETRFDRIKAKYKGELSVIDIEDQDVSYEDFHSMLDDRKVRRVLGASSL